MLRRWLSVRRLPPRFLPKPRPLALAGVVLGVALVLAAWRGVDARLAREASMVAAEGGSVAIAALRDDWVRHVLPVALASPGEAGAEARAVVAARLDAATSLAIEGDAGQLEALALELADGLRKVETTPTAEGADWGEWLGRRLLDLSDKLPTRAAVRLVASADTSLGVLARTPRRPPEPSPTSPQVVATQALPPTAPEPKPTGPPPPEPTSELAVVGDAPPVVAAVEPTPREGVAWRKPLPATAAQAPIPELEATEPAVEPLVRIADAQDLELLAEAVRLRPLVASTAVGTSALGPTRAPAPGEPEALDENRLRFDAVRRELRERGFGAISDEQALGLLDPTVAARLELVQRMLSEPSGDPARVLLTLSRDPSPEVRVAAISALGSSSRRALVEAALAAAVADSDPRVGRLAEPLRGRLR